MLKNEIYDLMETASVLSKGVYRYGTFLKDSRECSSCQQIWNYMRQTDEEQLRRILSHLKQHFDKEVELKIATA